MLFADTAMSESQSGIVLLQDVSMAQMNLLLKLYMPLEDHTAMMATLNHETVFPLVRIAHRMEFTFALRLLSQRLLVLVPQPTAKELQEV